MRAWLDAWLADPQAPPYLLLAARAGRGKSALLAHWVARLEGQGEDRPHVVFFPISLRFATNRENVVFSALYARLAHLYGDPVDRAEGAQEYRGLFQDYLRRPPPDGRPLLIALDGLDEAAGWEAGADLFPFEPPPYLRVVVVARVLAGGLGWLARLGWEAPDVAQTLSLEGLDRDGVRDVLYKMGDPLDALATHVDVVSRLHALSEGDPLLVRLYVDALLPGETEAATFRPEDLLDRAPGLHSYFDLWFRQQETLWRSDSQPVGRVAVGDLLSLCAMALGPLSKQDVQKLAPERLGDDWTIEYAVGAVNRFVIGEGTPEDGYVFSHPRLGEYFGGRLTRGKAEWQKRFLEYGKETLTALEGRTLKPKDASPYVVRYYGTHMTEAQAPAADFYALLCEGWLRAWEWIDGAPDGFLHDARRAWACAEAGGPAALGQQVRAALCFSSLVSIGANVPTDLLVACLEAGIIGPRLARVMARARPGAEERAACLAAIGGFFPAEERAAVLTEALDAVREIGDEEDRAFALHELAGRLPPEETALLAQALDAVRGIGDERNRGYALRALAGRLPPQERGLLTLALEAARGIDAEGERARALSAVAERIPQEKTDLSAQAPDATRGRINDEESRAPALSAVAERLSPEETSLLAQALDAARGIGDERSRAEALSAVAERLPPQERAVVLAQALDAARGIGDEGSRAEALSELAERLPPGECTAVLAQALDTARRTGDEKDRAYALRAVAELLPPQERAAVLAQALDAARRIGNDEDRAYALSELAERLPRQERRTVLTEALDAARGIGDEGSRAYALGAVDGRQPPEETGLLAQALDAARGIGDEGSRAWALSAVAEHLPPEERGLLAQALEAAREIGDEWRRADALRAVAARVLPEERRAVLAQALDAARGIGDEGSRAYALSMVAECLAAEERRAVLAEALHAAQGIDDEWSRAWALSAIAGRLPAEDRPAVLVPVLDAARGIGAEWPRARILSELAGQLSVDEAKWGIEILWLVRSLIHLSESVETIEHLAQHWSEMCHAHGFSELGELATTLHAFSRARRERLLEIVKALLPVIARLGGERALRETAQAIVDTGKWWP